LDEKVLEFAKQLIDFQTSEDRYGRKADYPDVVKFLKPTQSKRKDYFDILSYDNRLELAKIYLDKVIDEYFGYYFNYNYRKYSSYGNTEFEKLVNADGYEAFVTVESRDDEGYPLSFTRKTENFHQMFLDKLYEYWDNKIDGAVNDEDKQNIAELQFEFQLTGQWFHYNGFNQNMLRIYLEYLKNKGYKINIFQIFKQKVYKTASNMTQGLSHFTKSNLFDCLIMVFDFYTAVLEIYGEDNEKVINKLQNTLNHLFKEEMNVEKMGFMNTFLYTNELYPDRKRNENQSDVRYFWDKIYNEDVNPVVKKIFLNALVYTWNKSPIPKVRNSIQLIATLSTRKYRANWCYYGFPYKNQEIFYKDLLLRANDLKKSVKTILFSKAIAEEGGLYLGG